MSYSEEEILEAIKLYSSCYGRLLNKSLRESNDSELTSDFIKYRNILSWYTNNSSLPNDMLVFRKTVKEDALPFPLKYYYYYDLRGQVLEEKAFLSTSLKRNCLDNRFAILDKDETLMILIIKAPKGSKGVILKESPLFKEEREVLFAPNRKLKIINSYIEEEELILESELLID